MPKIVPKDVRSIVKDFIKQEEEILRKNPKRNEKKLDEVFQEIIQGIQIVFLNHFQLKQEVSHLNSSSTKKLKSEIKYLEKLKERINALYKEHKSEYWFQIFFGYEYGKRVKLSFQKITNVIDQLEFTDREYLNKIKYQSELDKKFPLEYADMSINCIDGIELPVHSVVLASRSEFFSSLLSGRWKLQKREIKLPKEFEPIEAAIALYYLHTGNLGKFADSDFNKEHLIEILEYFQADEQMIVLLNENPLTSIQSPVRGPHPFLHNPKIREDLADLIVILKDGKLDANKVYLSQLLIPLDVTDNVKIKFATTKLFEKIIGYLYEGRFTNVKLTEFLDLQNLIAKLFPKKSQEDVQKKLEQGLIDSLNDSNLKKTIQLAYDFKLNEVTNKCKEYMAVGLADLSKPLPKWADKHLKVDLTKFPLLLKINRKGMLRVKEIVSSCPKLVGFNLEKSDLTDEKVVEIFKECQNKNLNIILSETSNISPIIKGLAQGSYDLEDLQEPLTDEALWLLMHRYNQSYLDLLNEPQPLLTDKGLEYLKTIPLNVKLKLNLNGNQNITTTGLSSLFDVKGKDIVKLNIIDCTNLVKEHKVVNFDACSNLRSLAIDYSFSFDDGFNANLQILNKLSHLEVKGLFVSSNDIKDWLIKNSRLRKIILHGNSQISKLDQLLCAKNFDAIAQLPGNEKQLTPLSFFLLGRNGAHLDQMRTILSAPQKNLKIADLKFISENLPKIDTLNLAGNKNIRPNIFEKIKFPELKLLNISGCNQFDENALLELTTHFPLLEEIFLEDIKIINNRILNYFIKIGGEHLSSINVGRNNQITPLFDYLTSNKIIKNDDFKKIEEDLVRDGIDRYELTYLMSLDTNQWREVINNKDYVTLKLKDFDDDSLSLIASQIEVNRLDITNSPNLSAKNLGDLQIKGLTCVDTDATISKDWVKAFIANNLSVSAFFIRDPTFNDQDLADIAKIYRKQRNHLDHLTNQIYIDSNHVSILAIVKFMREFKMFLLFESKHDQVKREENKIIIRD